jgi:hypothetical protein
MAEAPDEGESHHMSDAENEQQQQDSQQAELFEEYVVPDYSDSSVWIRVETPELVRLGRDAGNDEGREVLSNRVLISYRKRTPEDGEAEFIREKPKSTVRAIEEEGIYWPSWGGSRPIDPRVQRSTPSRGWSLNRNSGVLRADGSIEP